MTRHCSPVAPKSFRIPPGFFQPYLCATGVLSSRVISDTEPVSSAGNPFDFPKRNGVEIQTYMAIIACLLILIHTGRTPTKRTFEMICLYMSGQAPLEELERHIEKLKVTKK